MPGRQSTYVTALVLVLIFTCSSASSVGLPVSLHRGLLQQTNILVSSGLQDGTILGHHLTGVGLQNSTLYNGVTQFGGFRPNSMGSWGQSFIYSSAHSNGNTDIAEVSGVNSGVTIGSVDFAQPSSIWMLDAVNRYIYKIDTSSSALGSGSVTGVYQSRPTGLDTSPFGEYDSHCTSA